ncbi:hypothetical protein BKA61DRAFT_3015 [Leptodontidium sp. MPI-SDFR-AT-0119]|nr:hypothetical protein BKA61DRAFT_3015 [Leptodontidium sp. MPI-SDFR-AT-0119]
MFLPTAPQSLNFLLLPLLLLAVVATAKSTSTTVPAATTADLFNLAYPVVAYPIASDKHDATTYLIACPKDTETSSCEFEQPFTLIEGPKTLHFAFVAPTASSTQTFIFDCDLRGTTSMGCTATGVSDDASPSAPITTTEALTYTGDAAKGFFRSVSLVGDSRELMTHTPGVLKGDGVYTTGGEVVVSKSQSETRVKATGSVTRTGVSTASASLTGSGSLTTKSAAATSVASVVVVLTTTTLSSKGSEAVESVSVVTDSVDVESTASTTPFEVSFSASGTVTPIPTISTSSGSRVDRVHEVLMAFTILAVVVVVGDSIS